MLIRRERCRPSRRNSTAEATTAGSSAPSVTSNVPSRRTASCRPGDLGHPADVLARRDPIAGLDDQPVLEREDDVVEIVEVDPPAERREQGLRDQPLDDPLLGSVVADRLELDLADGAGDDRAEVADARRGHGLAQPDRPSERGGLEDLGVRDRDPDADAGSLADLGRAPGEMGQLGEELLHEARHRDRRLVVAAVEPLLLLVDDRELVVEGPRIVRPDLRPEAVLERRDDPAAARVVLGVRARDDEQVEREADREAADLDVALLEDVQQAHLDPLGEVRQLVDREDPAVGARDQAVVEGHLVAEVAALGDPDRVDLADQVGDRDVRRRQLLGVAALARQPVDRGRVAVLGDDREGARRDRSRRVVVQLAAADDRDRVVEQADQEAGESGLRLAALAEEDEVLAGDDRVLDRGQDALVIADDAADDRPAQGEPGEQVRAELRLDRARRPAGRAQRSEGLWLASGIGGRRWHGRRAYDRARGPSNGQQAVSKMIGRALYRGPWGTFQPARSRSS